ncbi:MAG: DNA gyrase subunit A, partial [Anaerolineae bacterium]|nr:DNA gyrase subunit A [Anaerolineae bacterium]
IVSELPYQANKTTIIERIASLVSRGKLEGLADLRDESDRLNQVRLVIELQRGADATEIMAELFKQTPLQETFSMIMLALVNGQPRTLTLKQALRVYLEHRMEIVRRRSTYDLEKAKERAHILEGLLKALDNLDEVVQIIRRSRTVDSARNNLMKAIGVSERQATAILDMQLRRLASLERKKIEDEHSEKLKLIAYLEGLLENPKKMRMVIAEELATIKAEYNDPRRTIIASGKASSMSAEDFLVPEEPTWVTLTVDGLLGRTYDNTAPSITTKTKNPPTLMMESSTAQTLYLFTSKGECATIPIQQLPQVNEASDGTPFHSLLPLAADAEIVAGLCIPAKEGGYLLMATEQADVKRVRLEDLPGVSSKTFSVINVADEDRLVKALITDGTREVMLTTDAAQAIRFPEEDVRPMGLNAGGVRGVKLQGQKDRVVSAVLADDSLYVWAITDDGVAKISPCSEYPTQGRAGAGVITMRLPKESRELAAAAIGRQDDTLVALTNKNKPLYMRIGRAPLLKRGRAGGDIVISLRPGEQVTSVVTYQGKIEPIRGTQTEEE